MSRTQGSPNLRLLLVEDDPDTAEMMREILGDHFGSEGLLHVTSLADARAVDIYAVDLVLSDMNLPDGSGLELLEDLLLERPDLPVVFVTGEGVLENAVKAIREGAYDYVVKAGDYLWTLPIVVEKNLAMFRIKQENILLQKRLTAALGHAKSQNAALEQIAATDALTGIANRRAVTEAVTRRFAESHRRDADLTLLLIDLDGFKPLNDTLGHAMGDRLLEHTARVLEASSRAGDVPGRLGGDEFILVLPQTEESEAVGVARRLQRQFDHMAANEAERSGFTGRLSMSLGLASLRTSRAATPEALIEAADEALYAAKGGGRDQICVYRPEGLHPAVT